MKKDLRMGVRRNLSRGKRQHFAYPFQVADDAMQMGVHKTLYPFAFCTTNKAPCYGNTHKNAFR